MKRSSSRRALTHGRHLLMALVALVLLVAGVWSSWGTAQHVILSKGREHGTITIAGCGEEMCTGPYDPDGTATPRTGMTIEKSVAVEKGKTLSVVVKPGTAEVVRAGTGGLFHAWLPLGGALVLAALVIGGGLGLTRCAWAAAAVGSAVLAGTFFTM
ncbi:hypothetical protein [Streptomyces albipurpureus]|uniref:Integral membrane protein n=1 Tax=Streptomyces albipurpureus TaxID=2897419 RepID=A0ABT0URF0_9ACTN|nr:hypothetical protein [Streptomyces sp. CWNU-1]MCM2389963.1 hypothetical protein [Streptomyces sp. CWNU-1]